MDIKCNNCGYETDEYANDELELCGTCFMAYELGFDAGVLIGQENN